MYTSTHPHAVTVAGGNRCDYDNVGDMKSRTVGGTTYNLTHDKENRLTVVNGGGTTAVFTYDGDGNRVKSVIGSTKTYYIGNYYEFITSGGNSTIKKYYYLAGQLVCMRNNGTQKWLLSDHLGSMAITATNVGAWEGESRYRPYGKERDNFPMGAEYTTFHFTGQREEHDIGLYYYGARWYDAALGRFIQADPLVTEPGNPQAHNRYAYVGNNPLRFFDPTGHIKTESDGPPPHTVPEFHPLDYTDWIVEAMNYYASIPEIAAILPYLNCTNKGAAYITWVDLVWNQHPFDFKREMFYLSSFAKLDDYWFDYSTPGNIPFGFLGEAAGFSRVEIHNGASAAQLLDAAAERDDEKSAPGPFLPSFFDQVDDYEAIRFGRLLYREAYAPDNQVTADEFVALLTDFTPLTQCSKWTDPYSELGPYAYQARRFEGPISPFLAPVLPSW